MGDVRMSCWADSPCRKPAIAGFQSLDCDASVSLHGFDLALQKCTYGSSGRRWNVAKGRSVTGGQNGNNWVAFLLHDKNRFAGRRWAAAAELSSVQCDNRAQIVDVGSSQALPTSFGTVIRPPDVEANPTHMPRVANYVNPNSDQQHQAAASSAGLINEGAGNDSLCSSQEFVAGIVAALEHSDTSEQMRNILTALRLSSSDLNIILNAIKSPEKVTELFLWMKDQRTATFNMDICMKVFRVLGSRQQGIVIESLLRDLILPLQGEDVSEIFNILFDSCLAVGSSHWATKWFHLMLEGGVAPNRITYNLIMSLYRRHGKLEEAEFVYKHMFQTGVKCPKACSAMMSLYSRAGRFKEAEQIFVTMREENVEPDKEHWLLQLDVYVKQGKVHEAEEFMQQMKASGITADIFAYNSMITVNGKASHYKGARDWFDRLEEDGIQPDAVTYRSLIGACGRAGRLKEALNFYDRMRTMGFLPSIHNFNTLIHLHRKVGNDQRILCLLSDMKELRCCPDSSTVDAVVKVYERYGRLEDISQALTLLQEAGWSLSVKCYGILLRAYMRGSLVEQALDAFNHLCTGARLGQSLCHNLICLCKAAERYDEAIHVFQEMQRSGTTPGLRTSCTLMDIHGLKGAIQEAETIFKELQSSGQELDSVAYNVVINMYLRAGLLERAAEILKMVNEHEGFQPDACLFLSMLRVCTKCGMHQEGVKVYQWMLRSKLTWTAALYNGVIHCCGRALPLEQITKVFQAMVYAKVPVNTVTCNVMIDIFGKAGLLDKAENVLRLAQKQGVQDHISFNTIIDAYGKYKDFNKMEATLTEMQNEGFNGYVEAYNSMLDAYGKAGQVSKMEDILERMSRAGCNPNMSTFNTLINAYGKEGLIEELQGVLQQMEAVGMKPDFYTYNTLIHAYGNAEMPDVALNFFNEMQDAGFVPNHITYNCLIFAFEKSEMYPEVARWSSLMAQAMDIQVNPAHFSKTLLTQ